MEKYDDHKLRVKVKVRANHPRPYKWEIYEGDEQMWLQQSEESFASEAKARVDAQPHLERLLVGRRGKR